MTEDLTAELALEEWCKSRGITLKEYHQTSRQLRQEYVCISRSIRGYPVPGGLLERELVELVRDVSKGRFPLVADEVPVKARIVRDSV